SPWVPSIARCDSGGALIAWEDARDYANTSVNIYAQRVTATGTVPWTVDGVPVCVSTADQSTPLIVGDGGGGGILVWEDGRGGAGTVNLYAQRVLSDGTRSWAPADGIPLCSAAGHRSTAG